MTKQGRYIAVRAKDHEAKLALRDQRMRESSKKETKRVIPDFLPDDVLDRLCRQTEGLGFPDLPDLSKCTPKKALLLIVRAAASMLEAKGAEAFPSSIYECFRHSLKEQGIKPGKITRRLNRAARKAYGPAFRLG